MNILYLDIETLPAEDKSINDLKYLYGRKLEKKSKKKELSEEVIVEEGEAGLGNFIKSTSFDGGFGRVLCVGLAVNDDAPKCYFNQDDEKKTLEQFWKVASQCDLFVGHNVLDFDLRFLWQRSIVLGVKPTWQDNDYKSPRYLSFARYKSYPTFDTMHEWSKWGRENFGLEHVALALGIPTPKDGIDGSKVFDFYKAGKIKEICDYCVRDVETTRKIYKRMIFQHS